MGDQYRQGDVFIERAEGLPDGATAVPRDQGRVILAYGEVTGHAHALVDRGAELFSVPGSEDRWLVIRPSGTAVEGGDVALLTHEEHATIPIPPGVYRVRRQREYSPEEIRRVAD